MPRIQGLGSCSFCGQLVEIGQPARYGGGIGEGNVMVHKSCFDKSEAEKQTVEYQLHEAEQRVTEALVKLNSAQYAYDTARRTLEKMQKSATA